jgi:serine phosphatase RsbU (regulator of sigma subunit)
VITCEGGSYYIADQGSRSGTFVNEESALPKKLESGDRITFGARGIELVFQFGSPTKLTESLLHDLSASKDVTDLGKLTLFLQGARALNSIRTVEDVFVTLLDYALQLTGAERGFVYVKDAEGAPMFSCGRDSRGLVLREQTTISRSVLKDAFTAGTDFVVGDTTDMSMMAARLSIVANDLRTVIAIPLRTTTMNEPGAQENKQQIYGVLYLDSRLASQKLSTVGHDILRALAADAAALIENARLAQIERTAARYRQEMEIANSIQRSLIPAKVPDTSFATVEAHTIPCTEVGGDFYDLLVTADSLTCIMADISGKGISAALLASIIQGMLFSQLSVGVPLVDAVKSVNTFLCSRVEGRKYATMAIAKLAANGDLEIVNCGHVPPAIVENGKVVWIAEGDTPVGLFNESSFHVIRTHLPVGAKLVLLTDGLCEAENPEGLEFSGEPLEAELVKEEPMQNLFQAVKQYCQGAPAADDQTAMVVRRKG